MAIKHAILGLLHYGDMHGYRIKNHLENNFGHMWTVNFGQIYPALKQMHEEGLVNMKEVGVKDAPDRKQYSITGAGRREFREWLLSDPEKGMILRDPFLLRFTFLGFGDHKRAVEMIDAQISEYETQLLRRKENLPKWSGSSLYVRLVTELGVDFNRTMLDWLRHAKKEILKEMKSGASSGKK